MSTARVPVLVFAGLVFTVPALAAEQIANGQEVYRKWCTPCHGVGPDHPGTQALDAKYRGSKPGALEERTDLTPEITKSFVRNGVSIMPFFRKTEITDAELDALAQYLAGKK